MHSEKFTFSGHAGDELAARLDMPVGAVRAGAVFAHCFTCTKDIAAARRISARLTAEGFAVLSFDFTGLGHSAGEFANTHFSSNVVDLVAAASALAARGIPPQLLIGHSLGGAAVLAAAPRIAAARAVATIAAPHDPGHVLHNFSASLDEIQEKGAATVTLAGRQFTIRQSFVADVAAAKLDDALSVMKKALLVLHAPTDQVVGIENAGAIYAAARHPKSFVTLDRADHLLTHQNDAEYAARIIATWAERYLDAAPMAAANTSEGVVRVVEADSSGLRQDISADNHYLAADEPKSVGGSDSGMTPYQLLAAALGACTAMTLRLYARRKNLPLDRIAVELRHDKRHLEDCVNCEAGDRKIDRFERVIRLTGALDDETRQRLLEIADKCPVHRTLENRSEIVTRLG